MDELAKAFCELSNLEGGLKDSLELFAKNIEHYSSSIEKLNQREENFYLMSINEYIKYVEIFKCVLRLRDKKQIDIEELESYLEQFNLKKEKLIKPNTTTLSCYIRDGYDKFKGIDQEASRKSRLNQYNNKIEEIKEAIESSNDVATIFSDQVVDEFKIFINNMNNDFFEMTEELSSTRILHYKEVFIIN